MARPLLAIEATYIAYIVGRVNFAIQLGWNVSVDAMDRTVHLWSCTVYCFVLTVRVAGPTMYSYVLVVLMASPTMYCYVLLVLMASPTMYCYVLNVLLAGPVMFCHVLACTNDRAYYVLLCIEICWWLVLVYCHVFTVF